MEPEADVDESQSVTPRPVASNSRYVFAVGASLATLVALIPLTHRGTFSAGNDASRFAHMQALVEHGVPYIDQSRYRWTSDKVLIDGHLYSNKPPLLSIFGANLYWIIRQLTGWSFDTHGLLLTKVLTILLVGFPTAVLVGVFYISLDLHGEVPALTRWLTVGAVAAGTILTSYSVTLNNHTNAAAFLFMAHFAAWRHRFIWSGLCIGVTTWLDVLPGITFIPLLMWMAYAHGRWRGLWSFLLPGMFCALVFVIANWLTVGHWLVPKLVPGAVDQSSSFAPSLGGVLLPQDWYYPVECLIGGHGFLSVSPVLLFGAAGVIAALRKPSFGSSGALIALAASMCVFTLVHVCLVGSYGGWAYGFRYLIPLIPLLLFFVPLVMRGALRALYIPVLAASILASALGAYHPWAPRYEQEANRNPVASMVTNPVGGNAAAWLHEVFPSSGAATWVASRFISPDPARQRAYFGCFHDSKGIP